jgi:acyl-CoA thioester hydrolase
MSKNAYHHDFTLRVYYEDTDAGGVVYNANYLKFAERARTEMLREANLHQRDIRHAHDVVFVVTKANIRFKGPAHLDDLLTVQTTLLSHTSTRMSLSQNVFREGRLITEMDIEIACVQIQDDGVSLKAHPTPQIVLDALSGHGMNAASS